jgi:hypothetical protein
LASGYLKLPGAYRGPAVRRPRTVPGKTSFQLNNTSDESYNTPRYLQHKNDLQPSPSSSPPRLTLDEIRGADALQLIVAAEAITVRRGGRHGRREERPVPRPRPRALADVDGVADAMARGVWQGDRASVLLHLREVVFNFSEGQ